MHFQPFELILYCFSSFCPPQAENFSRSLKWAGPLKDPFAGKCIKNHIVSVTLFFKSGDKILILLQTCYKFISRVFRSHRKGIFGLNIFPTNLTPSNLEIKILKTPNFACFFRKTISKITFWPNIFCELVLRSRLSRIVPTTALEIALRHFQECKSTTGGGEAGNPPGKSLTFDQI